MPSIASRRTLAILALAAVAAVAILACSLLVERNPMQCQTDSDCERFGGYPYCTEGVCVASGLGPAGCFRGTPSTEEELLNQCTTGTCVPYDNCAKLGVCSDSLPSLVSRPDAGVAPKPDLKPDSSKPDLQATE